MNEDNWFEDIPSSKPDKHLLSQSNEVLTEVQIQPENIIQTIDLEMKVEDFEKRPTLATVDKEWLYNKYWNEKFNTLEIANILKCYTTDVTKKLEEFEIPRKPKGRQSSQKPDSSSLKTFELNGETYEIGDTIRVSQNILDLEGKKVIIKELSLCEIINIKSETNIIIRSKRDHKEVKVKKDQLVQV